MNRPITITGPGDQIIVPADSGTGIGVLTIVVVFDADATVTFKAGNRPLTGPMAMKASGSIVLDPISFPQQTLATLKPDECWLATKPGEALVVNLSTPAVMAGWINVTSINPDEQL